LTKKEIEALKAVVAVAIVEAEVVLEAEKKAEVAQLFLWNLKNTKQLIANHG
jgi:hypothetical protein